MGGLERLLQVYKGHALSLPDPLNNHPGCYIHIQCRSIINNKQDNTFTGLIYAADKFCY